MKKIILAAIRTYQIIQANLRRYRPPLFFYSECRFQPSCSEYALLAVSRYGAIKGSVKALWRTIRCNPFSAGGFEPLS